jgi:CDP-6-deoxy-D-xylo-4-hexulose-3-dehydrase
VRPTELNAFIGIEQLQYIDEICKKRYSNFTRIRDASLTNNELEIIAPIDGLWCSNFSIPILCKNKETRMKYVERASKYKIEIRPIVAGNITEQPFYKDIVKLTDSTECPNANRIHFHGFYIPNHPDLTEEELERMCAFVKGI